LAGKPRRRDGRNGFGQPWRALRDHENALERAFEFVDGSIIADAGGYPCSNFEEAGEIAHGLAMRLAREEPQLIGNGFAITAKKQNDAEVDRAELDKVNRLLLSS
jgi:hypothetical protein